ncbi:MAG: hypothetical protein OXE04_07470 [bacterium]|nr:hypothetical protein [bacterium]
MSVTILCPLAMEARAARRGVRHLNSSVEVLHTGMGPKRSRAVHVPTGVAAVVGLGGALNDELAIGDIVVATEVFATDVAPIGLLKAQQVAQDLQDAGFCVHAGSVACVGAIAVGVRRQELAQTGAVAVDMESAWLLEHHGGPTAVVRVISDTPSKELRSLTAPLRVVRALRTIRRMMPVLLGALDREV